jgi:hypothetical protein
MSDIFRQLDTDFAHGNFDNFVKNDILNNPSLKMIVRFVSFLRYVLSRW